MANELFIPTNIDAVLATSIADYRKVFVDNAYNSFTTLGVMTGQNNEFKRTIDGGVSIVEHLIDAVQDDGGFYSGADVLNTTQTDTQNLVEYRWQNAYEPITLTRDEERQNSGSEHKLIDLMSNKIKLSELAIQNRLDQALSTPVGGAGDLIDLETLVNTGTLGTIDGSTSTFWQSTVITSGAFATQGLTDMTTGYYAVSSAARRDNPTLFFTNKTIYQKFEETRLPLERLAPSADNLTANAGWDQLMFKGRTFTYGNFIGSGLLFGINQNYTNIVVDSATDFEITPFIQPSNQTVKTAFVLWRGNMTTNNRRRHYKLTSIT